MRPTVNFISLHFTFLISQKLVILSALHHLTRKVVGVTGLILTKLDGSLEVSVVDELGIPVKFMSADEGVEDLQPFDAEAFVNAIFM
ncbi:hypothetical protein RJT34_19951 [Clitoria ternatea]|uniref:SRP54-type proteins GTP-binding domain-containing protein n=1 Tax=Clitoria ternatea TaxID=43366 RepID=A0AAN9IRZ7_CLITE